MREKLTPEQKKRKRAELDIIANRNRIIVQWSTKKLRTMGDMLKEINAPSNVTDPATPLTHDLIMSFFQTYIDALDKPVEPGPQIQAVVQALEPEDPAFKELEEHEKLPESPNQKCYLYPFQERSAAALYYNITQRGFRGQYLEAGTGLGKTFIIGALEDRLRNLKFGNGHTFSPWPVLYITRSSIVEQTERVLRDKFRLDIVNGIRVINIEQMRATLGKLYVNAQPVVEYGVEHIKWVWSEGILPIRLYIDEAHAVKNLSSQQSQIFQAYNDALNEHTHQIFFSATPYTRVCEGKCFAVATRMRTTRGQVFESPLTNKTWPGFAKSIAGEAEPEEYNEAAVKRFTDEMDKYIVHVRGVRPQFNAINNVLLIDFQTKQEKEFYHKAWDRYERMRKKILGYELSGGRSAMLILAQFTIFRKAAELCRAPYLARAMWESVQKGEAAVLATNFKGTIRRVVKILMDDYNVKHEEISLIWGGGQTKKTEKQQTKENLESSDLMQELLGKMGIGLEDILGATQDAQEFDDDKIPDADYGLGIQNKKQRQIEIDRFQSGKSLYCCFTFKAGGVGLSLHHTDEMTTHWNEYLDGFDKFKKTILAHNAQPKAIEVKPGKIRRKKNNWVYPEEVQFVPVRPRRCFLSPTFSVVEFVQGLGRCPRLTSLSDTYQTIIFYRGTIEERVAALVNLKLRCLRHVIRSGQRESWESAVTGSDAQRDETLLITNDTEQKFSADDASMIGEITTYESEDDDDEGED